MKFIRFVVLFIALTFNFSNCYSDDLADKINQLRLKIEKQRETVDVAYFTPKAIGPEWSVILASIKTIKPKTAEVYEIDQLGDVILTVNKNLYGKPLAEITLPYRYTNMAVFKVKDSEISKHFKHYNYPRYPDELVWPSLPELKEPYLLVVINPHALDPMIINTDKPTTLAARVFETSGENDPRVIDLLKQIPK